MFFFRRTHRFTAWLACFAILVATFAPTVSHAIAAKHPVVGFLAKICSTSATSGGDAWVVVGDQQELPPSGGPSDTAHVEHCPFCTSQAGVMGILPSTTSNLSLPLASDTQPPLFYHAPRPLPIWAAARSRAPPSL